MQRFYLRMRMSRRADSDDLRMNCQTRVPPRSRPNVLQTRYYASNVRYADLVQWRKDVWIYMVRWQQVNRV